MGSLDSPCSCRKLIGASAAHGGPVVSTGTNRGTPAPRRFEGAPLGGTPSPKASRIPRRGRPSGLDAAFLPRHPCATTHQGIHIPRWGRCVPCVHYRRRSTMKSYDMSFLARDHGFAGKIRVSERVMNDWMVVAEHVVSEHGGAPIERFHLLLQSLAGQLSEYPAGTQPVRVTPHRI